MNDEQESEAHEIYHSIDKLQSEPRLRKMFGDDTCTCGLNLICPLHSKLQHHVKNIQQTQKEKQIYEVDLSRVDHEVQDSIGKLQDELRLEHEQQYPPDFVPDEEPPPETNLP